MRLPSGDHHGPPSYPSWCVSLLQTGAVDIHYIDIEVTVLEGSENQLRPIRRQHTFGGIDAEPRQPAQSGAVSPSRIDVERIQTPDVPLRWIRSRRTLLLQRLARRVKNPAIAVHEIAAGRFPDPVRDAVRKRPVDV